MHFITDKKLLNKIIVKRLNLLLGFTKVSINLSLKIHQLFKQLVKIHRF